MEKRCENKCTKNKVYVAGKEKLKLKLMGSRRLWEYMEVRWCKTKQKKDASIIWLIF